MSVQSLLSRKELVELLKGDKEFRDSFALEYVKNSIPSQIRALRKEREWTQEDLGKAVNKPRNVITRLENPNQNIPNLATMYEIAVGCDAALIVKIVPFSQLLKEYSDSSFEDLYAPSIFNERENKKLDQWADEGNSEKTSEPSERRNSSRIIGTTRKPRLFNPLQPELKGLGPAGVPSKNTVDDVTELPKVQPTSNSSYKTYDVRQDSTNVKAA